MCRVGISVFPTAAEGALPTHLARAEGSLRTGTLKIAAGRAVAKAGLTSGDEVLQNDVRPVGR
jgi:hypothetical protein